MKSKPSSPSLAPPEARYTSGSTHPAFEPWWEQFGESLIEKMAVRDIAFAAWAAADWRARREMETLLKAEVPVPPEARWQPIATAPENVVVLTKIDDDAGVRNEQLMKRQGRLWWFADGSMYVYYVPTHWKPLPESPR